MSQRFRHSPLYRLYGEAEARGDLFIRQTGEPAQDEDVAERLREGQDHLLQEKAFELGRGGKRLGRNVERVSCADASAADVETQVRSYPEQEGTGMPDSACLLIGREAEVSLLDEIFGELVPKTRPQPGGKPSRMDPIKAGEIGQSTLPTGVRSSRPATRSGVYS